MRVWVLTPRVEFEDTRTEATLDPANFKGPQLASALTEKAISTIRSKGIREVKCLQDGDLSTEQIANAEQVVARSRQLLRGMVQPEDLKCLQVLGTTNESTAVLTQLVRVKVGPAGTWDPNTGAITSGASSAHFRASLVDTQTGRQLWKNSVYLRHLPQSQGKDFEKVTELLYTTLNPQPQKP